MKLNKLNLEIQKTASFDVDPQKTFTTLCPDELPVESGLDIVPHLLKNHEYGVFKISSRDCHSMNAKWITMLKDEIGQKVDGDYPDLDVKWVPHAIIGTVGWDFIDGLPHPVRGYDFCVSKGIDADLHPYGACYHCEGKSTGAIEFLTANGIENVVVGGLALDFCVKLTCIELVNAGFNVYLNIAATKAVFPQNAEKVIEELKSLGVVVFED